MITASGRYAEFRQHWRLLLAAAVGASFGLPNLAFYTIGIFAPVFGDQFGWPYGAMMSGLFLTSVVILICGPFIGRHIDRHGSRGVASGSLLGVGLCYMTLALADGSLTLYFASWIAMAVFGIGATAISFTHAINRAFVVNRGLALGITLAGAGLFALAVKPFAGWSNDLFGWRATIVAIGLLPILVGAPLVLWAFPRRSVSEDQRKQAASGPGPTLSGLTLREALRSRYFWLIGGAFVPISLANGAPLPNMENILRTLKFDPAQIVGLTSLIGLSILSGRLLGGWVVDRVWAPVVGAVLLTLAASGCWLLSQPSVDHAEAVTAVVLISFAAGVEYDLLAFLIARYMGSRSYGAIYSLMFGAFAIGAGGGPVLMGRSFDRVGDYSVALIICASALLFAAALLLALGRYPRFESRDAS